MNLVEETLDMEKVWTLFAANKKKTFVAVVLSPALRVSLGERFGFARGEDCACKLSAILRVLGADAVVDSAICADVITLANAKKVWKNKEKGTGTVVSSACPAFVEYAKENAPDLLENSMPTAMELCARLVKKYYREQFANKSVRVIALTTCAKKREIGGADIVLGMDELVSLLSATEVDLRMLQDEPLDTPLGVTSGAGYLCSASGGETEALIRCLQQDKSDFARRQIIYSGIYHGEQPRVAEVEMNGNAWKFAVACCLEDAQTLVQNAENGYDFIEICARKGGQIGDMDGVEDADRTLKLRGLGLRYLDESCAARSSDFAPAVAELLKTWQEMVRSGEAFEENEDFASVEIELPEEVEEVQEVQEVQPPVEEIPVVEEVAVEEVVEVVEQPAPVVEKTKTTKGKKDKKQDQAEMDDIIDRWDELDEKTKSLYYRRFSTRERKRLARKNRSKK